MRHLALVCLIASLAVADTTTTFAADERPNIIYVMLDDAGYGDFGAFGSTDVQTPVFDRMCADGTKFTDHYSGSGVCAPTRCVLMTGLHTGHCRRRDNTATGNLDSFEDRPLVFLEPDDVTVAEALHEAGYVTGGIGKWGLGNPGTQGAPNHQGFDHFFGYLDQVHAHTYYTDWLWKNGERVELPGNQGGQEETYSHDLLEADTLRFIHDNKDRPFFLYLCYTLPHSKYVIPEDDPAVELYRDKPWPQQIKNYAAMITRADRSVGQVLDTLQALGLDDQTIVFYTSDNGPNSQFAHALNSAAGLRGTKRDLYEGGIRAAMAVRWPGHVPAGRTSDFVWSMVDVFPTLCELAGATPPDHLDGISVVPTLLGHPQQGHDVLYWEIHHPFHQAVRMGKWKGVRFGTDAPLELYNLEKDPTEENTLAEGHPEVVRQIERHMDQSHVEDPFYPSVAKSRRRGGRGA